MARRNSKQDESVETEATTAEGTEPTDTEASTEQAEGNTDSTPTQAEPDLTAFKAAVKSALGEGDTDTGVLPVAAKEPVAKAYRELDGQKAKNQAKSLLDEGVKASIIGGNLPHARSYTELRDAVNEATAKKAEKEPADPKVAFVNRLAGLRLAQTLVESQVPEGVDAEAARTEVDELVTTLAEDLEKYRVWATSTAEDKGDAPEVSPVVRAAFKLSTGKASGGGSKSTGSTYSGARRDVAKHIQQAFADKEAGAFLKISEIANFKSDEYGDDHPSQGAVSARLFPQSGKVTIEGIEPVQKDEAANQPRGARKVA